MVVFRFATHSRSHNRTPLKPIVKAMNACNESESNRKYRLLHSLDHIRIPPIFYLIIAMASDEGYISLHP